MNNNNSYDPNGFYGGYDNNDNNGSYNSDSYGGNYNGNSYGGNYGNSGYGGGGFGGGVNNPSPYAGNQATVSLAEYTRKVFGWMFIGLLITFGICLFIGMDPLGTRLFIMKYAYAYYILLGVEVLLVFILGFFVAKMPPAVCLAVFLAYSAINGFTIGPLLVLYTPQVTVAAFGVTAGIFGAMAAYGYLTKRDLSGLGTILMFGLIGLVLFSVISMFVGIPMSDLPVCLIGIAIFIGFTAYDTQKIKRYYSSMQYDSTLLAKGAVIAALDLYLDFINLFLYILRLFSSRRN